MLKKNTIRILSSLLIFIGLDLLSGLFLIPESFNSFRIKHYYFHHGLMPGKETMAAWGALIYPMHTNSLGMVDSTRQQVARENSRHRILILGDSHAEGVGVPYPLTFAGRLASELSPTGIEVLNASAVSYSQKTEYLKARYLMENKGLQVDEILLLVDISDIQNELVYEDFQAEEKSVLGDFLFRTKTRLTKRSTLYYLVDAIQTQKQKDRFFKSISSFNEGVGTDVNNNVWELYASFFSDFNDEVLLSNPQFHGMGSWMEDDKFRDLALKGIGMGQSWVLKLKELCEAKGIKLTISIHPWHHQIERGEVVDDYARNWEAFALGQDIPFISFYPLFINEEDPGTVIGKYYIKNDNHWNEFGHERVADYLKDYFLSSKK